MGDDEGQAEPAGPTGRARRPRPVPVARAGRGGGGRRGDGGADGAGRAGADRVSTSERILDAALASFATRGYEASSLDGLAQGLEIRKQTILYWFPSKEVLLEAVIDRSAVELSAALEQSLATAGGGWARVEAVVRSVFRLAARRPELLGLVREMGRLGTPAATRLVTALDPLVERAADFLQAEMDAGTMRRHEPRLLLLAIYSTVIGMVTEVEVLRAFGEEPTARSLVRRRNEILALLRSALVTEPD
jgi:AcrR family transcriptional regulator